ncbi:50S ribosomal protein L4 [Candidatus Fermentibacterales bacterium]|nr:50S ribosomal protein L4 [Candidatus Fermentibacterales bacterium]
MPEARVYSMQGEEVGMIDLPVSIFGVGVSTHLLWEVVRAETLNARRGTSSTKTRSEVRASGSKPWRQKHTGRARAGSFASPIWQGGGVAHGPRPRTWNLRVNRKVRRKALAGILTERFEEGNVRLIRDLSSTGRTREMAAFLKDHGCEGRRIVLILGEGEEPVARASRNLPRVEASPASNVTVTSLVDAEVVILSERALAVLEERVR